MASNVFVTPAQEPQSRKAVLIVNTKSRRGREWKGECQRILTGLGIDLEHTDTFRTIQELVSETSRAISRKVPLIIAGGGDGTFSAIARLFVGSQSVLGVLPLGTGNQFARDLGIPADPQTACEIAVRGKVASVDMGMAAGDYFLNVATVGVSTLIAQNLTVESKRKFGRFVYAFALANALRVVKPFIATLETDNGMVEFETLQVVIGNGRYHAGPFAISPDASITEGKLSIYALKSGSRGAFLKLGLYLPTGHQGDMPEVHSEEATRGVLTAIKPQRVTIDGEVCARTPLTFGIAPDCLRVMAPLDFAG
ncbi:MAG: YegS/Rv2252/BmrU family lipid kinase [Fimbriimonas sp.]